MSLDPPADACSDFVIASNRLPFTLTFDGDELRLEPSSGGLVTALQGARKDAVWVGWPGVVVPPDAEARGRAARCRERLLPGAADRGRAGGVLRTDLQRDALAALPLLRRPHALHARGVGRLRRCQPSASPRRSPPSARHGPGSGFTTSISRSSRGSCGLSGPISRSDSSCTSRFPSSEIYRILPTRTELLRGMLGADYIGFHTGDYARHFRSSCLRVLGIETGPDTIDYDDRTIGIGAHPIGIDVESFRDEPARSRRRRRSRPSSTSATTVSSSCSASSGSTTRRASRRSSTRSSASLEHDPELADRVTMLQVLVPSRLESAEYRAMRDEIEMRIAHINGRFGRLGHSPVAYVHRSVSPSELVALYRRADVMMVTPLRDGMNLVAQEFVQCQTDDPGGGASRRGALLLSEFAGAAHVLPGAVLVNPWDVDELAARLVEALALDAPERRRRLELMASRVEQLDSTRWARVVPRPARAVRAPGGTSCPAARRGGAVARRPAARRGAEAHAHARLRRHAPRARRPSGSRRPDRRDPRPPARPRRAARRRASTSSAAGRASRSTPGSATCPSPSAPSTGTSFARRAASGRRRSTSTFTGSRGSSGCSGGSPRTFPGTMVERKTASVAWHYRQAEPEYGIWRARELLVALENVLAGISAEVLPGRRVIEVRARGVNKGVYLEGVLAAADARTRGSSSQPATT